MAANFQLLSNRSLLVVEGRDSVKFLQGIITNDMRVLQENGGILYSLMLTPQGRFLYDFFIISNGDNIYIDHEEKFTNDIINKLNFYKLRADVSIGISASKWNVFVVGNQAALAEECGDVVMCFPDPRSEKIGFRVYVLQEYTDRFIAEHNLSTSDTSYDDIMYNLVIPEPHRDMISEKSFPLEYGVDHFHAISFNKGCYLGQELTTRTKHRGVIRKRLHKFISDREITNVEIGTPILVGDLQIGIYCSSHGKLGKALLRIEDYENAMSGAKLNYLVAKLQNYSVEIY